MYDFKIVAHEENDHFWSSCPDIPEAHSAGDTLEELLANAVEGITLALSIYVDRRKPIPQASGDGDYEVQLPSVTVSKIVLWNQLLAKGQTKADLANALKISPTAAARLVDFEHTSKMEQLEKALSALSAGVRIVPADPEWITLPHGGGQAGFYVGRLLDELKARQNMEMVVGAVTENLDQVKPESLDYFLRTRYAKNPNIMQAVRGVIQALVDTGTIEHIPRQAGVPAGFIRLK
ncbi:type II toxin-antitoxin system HicB family antitoxin [Pseudomonas sp. L7]|uniref:type II toxin-antitoxin system HicB family antitoxin n=1 Tax=Pseudomonas sp. L7 TaxID=3388343 RepID=UPI00398522B1